MGNTKRGFFQCWGVLLLLLLPARARAFECKVSDKYEYVTLRWPDREIPWGVRQGTDAPLSQIVAAFGAWSEQPCTDIDFNYVGVITPEQEAAPNSRANVVAFVQQGWEANEGRENPRLPSAVAVTVTRYTLDDGLIRSSSIEVNEEFFKFSDVEQQCDTRDPSYDLIAVLTHEVGHFIGLDHTRLFSGTSDDPTMAPEVGECESDKRTLENDDIEALCLIYPKDSPNGACGTLPDQEDNYVRNRIFGCTAARGEARAGSLGWVYSAAIWLCFLGFLSWRSRH